MLAIPLAVQIKNSNKCHVQAILRSVHRTALFSWNDVERGGNPHGVMVGFCPTQSKGGDGRLNKVSKGSGPYHCCPFPRRIPNSSCFCLTRSIYQACTFGGWAQPWPFKIQIDPITLGPLPNPPTNFILRQALMRATIVVENM